MWRKEAEHCTVQNMALVGLKMVGELTEDASNNVEPLL